MKMFPLEEKEENRVNDFIYKVKIFGAQEMIKGRLRLKIKRL